MEKKKNKILNVIIGILVIALVYVIIVLISGENTTTSVEDENTLREKIKENITYEYITKPQEEQNAMMEEEEKMQNLELQNEILQQQEEMANDMVSNIQQGVEY